jgi:hypothetical protein
MVSEEHEDTHGVEVPFSGIIISGLFPKRGGEHAMSLDKDSAGVPPCPHPDCVPKVSHEIECRCDIA